MKNIHNHSSRLMFIHTLFYLLLIAHFAASGALAPQNQGAKDKPLTQRKASPAIQNNREFKPPRRVAQQQHHKHISRVDCNSMESHTVASPQRRAKFARRPRSRQPCEQARQHINGRLHATSSRAFLQGENHHESVAAGLHPIAWNLT